LNSSRAAATPEVESLMRRLEAAEAALDDERRRAESLSGDIERHLRNLADALPNLCWLTRADGYVYWFNERYRDHTGISPDKAKGWGWRELYPPNVAGAVFAAWRKGIASGEGFTATMPLPTPAGRLKEFQVRIEPFGEGFWFGVNIEPSARPRSVNGSSSPSPPAASARGSSTSKPPTTRPPTTARPITAVGRTRPSSSPTCCPPSTRPTVRASATPWIRRSSPGSDYDIEYRVIVPSGDVRWLQVRGQAAITGQGGTRRMAGVSMDVTERKEAEERQRLLLNELNHRVKNTLATVQSIASQTLRTATSETAFRDAFEARLVALSKTHNLLTDQNWRGASLHDLVISELRPHAGGREGGGARILLESDRDIRLNPKAAVALGMAVHELATNAVKYGALSVPGGRVTFRSRVDGPRLIVDWAESGGPPVTIPQRRGFGSRLLEQGLAGELAGDVRLGYLPAGLICHMELPLHALEPDE
jgi:two-component sensor histidine kinase/PAS domain-containing protein